MSHFGLTPEESAYVTRIALDRSGVRTRIAFYSAILVPMLLFAGYGVAKRDFVAELVAFIGLFLFVLWHIAYEIRYVELFRSLMRKVAEREHPGLAGAARVAFDDERVMLTGRRGGSVAWNDLREIAIRTTDQGPFVDDVIWVLTGSESQLSIPSETAGMTELLPRLQQLAGFDNEAVVAAMGSTDHASFVCWKRDSDSR